MNFARPIRESTRADPAREVGPELLSQAPGDALQEPRAQARDGAGQSARGRPVEPRWRAHQSGRDGDRLVMEILAKRKNQKLLYQTILDLDPKAFVITVEPKQFHGGFWTRSIKK